MEGENEPTNNGHSEREFNGVLMLCSKKYFSYDFFWALFLLFMYKSIPRSHNRRRRCRDRHRHRETLIV